MITDIFKDAFDYSSKDVQCLLKLGVLSILSFLIFPFFMMAGYAYRIIGNSVNGMINGNDPLPGFENLMDMFIDGIKLYLVKFIYLIIPTVLTFVLSIFTGPFMFMGFILGVIITIFFGIFALFAIDHMVANNGSVSQALNIKEIYDIINSIGIMQSLKLYLGLRLMELAIVAVVMIVFMIISIIIGGVGYSIQSNTMFDMGGLSFEIISLIIILLIEFIIAPFIEIFDSRVSGLIYSLR